MITLKTRKIRNVPKNVCTAEEKLAYNIAFRIEIGYGDLIRKLKAQKKARIIISNFIWNLIRKYLNWYKEDCPNSKYNIDAVQVSLMRNLENYIDEYFIASDYETIGERFRIPRDEYNVY